MSPVTPIVQNPLTVERDSYDRAALRELFPALQAVDDDRVLALRPYLRDTPQVWFDRAAYEAFGEWLHSRDTNQRRDLRDYLGAIETDLNRAFLFLREINSAAWQNKIEDSEGEFELVRFIDRTLHPAYLRLVEGVLTPLVRVVAHFSRLDRGARTEGLEVWQVVEELRRGEVRVLVASYRHLMRNAIAHGGVTYLQNEIRYRDKKGNESTHGNREVIRATDDLVDACNGIAAALKTFLVAVRVHQYRMPRELLVEELKEETKTPWWSVEGCVESAIGERSQLLVYCRTNSRDFNKVQYSAIQTGILTESLVPGYDRYFLSLRSEVAWPGWAGFDGARMRSVRESDPVDVKEYKGVVENDMVFYVPRRRMTRLGSRIDTYRQTFLVAWPQVIRAFRSRLGIPELRCRGAKLHRNAWGIVLSASIVAEDWSRAEADELVHRFKRRMIRIARRAATPAIGSVPFVRHLPIAFARIGVYRRDYRPRRLTGYGLGEDLICTVQFQRMQRIRSPDIMDSTVEAVGKWRIAWNKSWLESVNE